MKNIVWVALVALIIGALGYYAYIIEPRMHTTATQSAKAYEEVGQTSPEVNAPQHNDSETPKSVQVRTPSIGTSANGNPIDMYHFGSGEREVVFIGGIHGGYEWNTSLLAYRAIEWFKDHENDIPKNVSVTIIPLLNPDGMKKVTSAVGETLSATAITASQQEQVAGRFNGNGVDLNRNFDCDWKKEGVWQDKKVNGGSAPFSEPESQAVRTYMETHTPSAVVVWYSAAGGVYASSCHDGVLPKTKEMTDVYARASGYPAHTSFDFYEVSGDMVNWLAKQNTPAISVLLSDHTDIEWDKNYAGIKALIEHVAK